MDIKEWELIEQIGEHADKILIRGKPALGKSYMARLIAKKANKKLYIVPLTNDTPVAELRGHYLPVANGGHTWHDGPITKAWREGAVLLLDEIDQCAGDVEVFLHSALDDPGMAEITLPNNETIKPKKGFQCIATMNGDFNDLNEALASRFPVKITVNEPNPEAINCLPDDLKKPAMGTVTLDGDRRKDLRQWFAFADLRKKVDKESAAKAVFQHQWEEVINSLLVVEDAEKETIEKVEISDPPPTVEPV